MAFSCLTLVFTPLCIGHGVDRFHRHLSSVKVSVQGSSIGHIGLKYHVDLEWAKADPDVAQAISSHTIA
jgi:hypothetical protein